MISTNSKVDIVFSCIPTKASQIETSFPKDESNLPVYQFSDCDSANQRLIEYWFCLLNQIKNKCKNMNQKKKKKLPSDIFFLLLTSNYKQVPHKMTWFVACLKQQGTGVYKTVSDRKLIYAKQSFSPDPNHLTIKGFQDRHTRRILPYFSF